MPGFKQVVQDAWSSTNTHTNPAHRLNFKLARTALALRKWSKKLSSKAKLQFHMAQSVILQLDIAQESRTLSDDELAPRSKLKKRIMGLAILERLCKRQCSRITNLSLGDANTRFFHLKVNSRRRKNFITKLQKENGWVTTQQDKADIGQTHFANVTETRN